MSNFDSKQLKALGLNETMEFTKGSLKQVQEQLQQITSTDAAYAFVIGQKSTRIYTLTRVLPEKFSDRAVFFDTIKKTDIKRAMKANNNVKVKAAAALGMSPRTFRRKIAELDLNF